MAQATAGSGAPSEDWVSSPGQRAGATRFLIGAGISNYGDWLTTVALLVLLYRLTGSATAPAIYILARSAPRVLGPPLGGMLADRFGPARIAAICSLIQAAVTASIVGLALAELIWGIYVAVAASQFLGSMAQPAYYAAIPQVVTADRLGRVNALYQAILESCILAAPALGAILLMAGVTPEALIVGDAASFVVAAAVFLTLRARPTPEPAGSKMSKMRASLNIVRRSAVLRIFAWGHLTNAFVITALQAVLVVAASQRFGADTVVGWLYAAVGAGGLAGSMALLRWPPTRVRSRDMVLAVFGELIPLTIFAFVSTLALGCALLFVSAFSAAIYQTSGALGLQQTVPQHSLGRVNAVIRIALYLGMLLGAIVAATTAQFITWDRLLLIVSGVGMAVLVLAVLTQPRSGSPEVEVHGKAVRPETVVPKL